MKPSIGVLALPGFARDPRGTLVLVAVPLLATLPFLATWADWVTVLRNAQGIGVFYSLVQWTVFTIVALPWLTTRGIEWAGGRFGRSDQEVEDEAGPTMSGGSPA
jgi:hypothetical protein